MLTKSYQYFIFLFFTILFIIPIVIISQTYSIAVTAGKSYFKTKEELIILKTANNKNPTLSQGPIAFISDTMIYDESLKIGFAYGNLRFVDLDNRTYFSAQEGTYFSKEKKIVLRKSPEILLEQDSTISTKITGRIITIYPDDSYIIVKGNIIIDDGNTIMTGEEAKIWSKEDKMVVSGNVQVLSDDQKLRAEKLSIQFNNGSLSHYVAQENVIAVNTVDNFTLQAGVLSYNQEKDFYKAIKEPSIYFKEQDTISYANIIEYTRDTQLGYLIGDVISIQGSDNEQKAYSRWAIYNGSNNTINMYGNPRLKQKESELFGTEIIVNIDSNNMTILGGGRGFFDQNQ